MTFVTNEAKVKPPQISDRWFLLSFTKWERSLQLSYSSRADQLSATSDSNLSTLSHVRLGSVHATWLSSSFLYADRLYSWITRWSQRRHHSNSDWYRPNDPWYKRAQLCADMAIYIELNYCDFLFALLFVCETIFISLVLRVYKGTGNQPHFILIDLTNNHHHLFQFVSFSPSTHLTVSHAYLTYL